MSQNNPEPKPAATAKPAPQPFDLAAMRKVGTLQQRQPEFFVLRVRFPAGDATAKQLTVLSAVSQQYGRGEVHLSVRQGAEIPFVHQDQVLAARKALEDGGLLMGACGPRVRAVVTCPGNTICRWGIIDTKTISRRLDKEWFAEETPHKFKFTVTGCPHNCAKATENDFGIMGGIRPKWAGEACTHCDLCLTVCPTNAIVKTGERYEVDFSKCIYCSICTSSCPTDDWKKEAEGYLVWIGGTMGKVPRLATLLTGLIEDVEQVFKLVSSTVAFYRTKGRKKQRFGHFLDSYGVEKAKAEILSDAGVIATDPRRKA